MKLSKKWYEVLAVVVVIVALLVMQTGSARAQQQSNYTTVQKTTAAVAALYGAGAAACALMTPVGCGAGIIIGGAAMGVVATALNYFPPPNDTVNMTGGSVVNMPDYEDAGGGVGADEDCGDGGGDGGAVDVLDPEGSFGCE